MNKSMKSIKGLYQGLLLSLTALPAIMPMQANAEISGANMIDYISIPVTSSTGATPQVMFVMGKDHQYWFKAYNDYTDLDPEENDGIETTYKHSFKYYGYFDPDKCYSYVQEGVSGAGQVKFFKPMAFTPDGYCDGSMAGEWSGNFLNWASMTRMDIVRRIMFGGKRMEDNSTLTLLQRAHLTTDAHSFAKYYNGDDLGQLTPFTSIPTEGDTDPDTGNTDGRGITICNTSLPPNNGKSESVSLNTNNTPPLMRIAKGNYSLWASNERWQCRWSDELSGKPSANVGNGNDPDKSGIPAYSSHPNSSTHGVTSNPDYNVYIQSCVAGLINSDNNENCKQYPDGNYKPIGLIQRYGEDEILHFGLMQGSYEKNLSGGVLRKNIGNLADEINMDTDGTLKADANSSVPAVGMTRSLDALRIHGYRYGDGVYNETKAGCIFDWFQCPAQTNSDQGKWASWGNPISEIYSEAIRYFAGLSKTDAFDAKDTNFIGGLAQDDWEDPYNEDNFCAAASTIVFNTSTSSYDHDQTGNFTDIDGASHPSTLTDTIGDSSVENPTIHGNEWFIGQTPDDNDKLCTPKTIDSLGNSRGICAEGPTLNGSYHLAGMAHYANTEDIRPDIEGTQTVTTYAVQLATTTPNIEVPLPSGEQVTILPAYRLNSGSTIGGGALVDFKIVEPHDCNGSNICTAKFYINWEDSEFGGDYDQDMWGILEYELDTNANTIKVTTDAIADSTDNPQLFGFVISGTTQDGFHAYTGIHGANNTGAPAAGGAGSVPGCSNCQTSDGPESHTFHIGGSSAGLLENPLYYAAKWGGFEDQNGNGIPDLDEEWDETNNDDGSNNPDGVPDNYFFVSNPAKLEDALRRVFDAILERVSSGTAASVVANEQEGTGAIFQALYDPIKTDDNENEVEWIGTLHSLFIDPDGRLREDSNGNAQLDGYQTDKVVQIFFDAGETQTKLRRFSSSSDDEFISSGSVDLPLTELDTIWNARDQLSAVTDVTTQRNYSTSAANGRHITTWIDSNHDGIVDDGEQVAFEAATFTANNRGWLDQSHATLSANDHESLNADLVNYIRGEEINPIGAGITDGTNSFEQPTRNRRLDYDGDGTTEIMRLGDIVNSTPTPVQAPFEAFDLLAGDASYAEFRQEYATRRQVVYVGGNDGMIHAFNAGFFDANTREFKTSLGTETAHPLGAELWAYVPKNLLPHLQWLAREDYEHVYFADLKPRVFDAKIFPDDPTHPNGWGTVLVVGFRLGGGTDTSGITVDTAGDGLGGTNAADDVKTKSAFVVMDVTDPEQEPEVIAELTPPDLNFTTSFPAVVLVGDPEATGAGGNPNKWYLVFGSGPTNLGTVSSGQRARLFAYDLEDMVDGEPDNGRVITGPFANDLGADAANSFVGDAITADFDFDMKAEVVYFGTVGDTDSDEGKLFRLPVNEKPSPNDWGPAHVFLDANQPFSAQPSVALDDNGNPWVIAGTGRFYADGDKPSTATQTLYGIKDPNDLDGSNTTESVSVAELYDVTDVVSLADGTVILENGDTQSHDQLENCTTGVATCNDGTDAKGWRRDYESDGTNPAQRSVNRSSVLGGVVLNTAFTPSTSQCGLEGSSILLGLGFNTGVSVGAFGSVPCPTCPNEADLLPPSVDLGYGLASSPSIHIGKPGQEEVPGKVTVIIQKSTGEISGQETQVGGGINSGEVSWREYINE